MNYWTPEGTGRGPNQHREEVQRLYHKYTIGGGGKVLKHRHKEVCVQQKFTSSVQDIPVNVDHTVKVTLKESVIYSLTAELPMAQKHFMI